MFILAAILAAPFVLAAVVVLFMKMSHKKVRLVKKEDGGSDTIKSAGIWYSLRILFGFEKGCNRERAMELYERYKKESAYHTYLGPLSVIWALDAKDARKILMDRKIFKAITLPESSSGGLLIAKSFGSMGEDIWKVHSHNIILPAFTNLEIFFPLFNDTINECVEKWQSQLVGGKATINTPEFMGRLTLDVLGRCLFGHDFKCISGEADELREHYNFIFPQFLSMTELVLPFLKKLPTKYGRDFTLHYNGFVDGMNQIINKARTRESKGETDSLLDSMLRAVDSEDLGFTEEMVLHNISAFFLAGHETTATGLGIILWCLARYQDVQQKVYEEVQTVIEPNDFVPYDKLPELEYMNMTLNECFRLYFLGAGFLREVMEDTVVGGYRVPKGYLIGVNQAAMAMKPEYWDNPEEFNPDRFIPENSKKRPYYAFTPFSTGPHTCTGKNFSIMEQKMFIAKVLNRFKLSLPKGQEEIKYRPCDEFNALDEDMRLIIERRK
ncbi:cytochrome P450 [Acrasis kona]|uniref:Cytochrome P450 n=1 Tax=Acrasis kona TaxID=1008807 RepID=A0AAW2ZE36_9EUKA